MKIKNILMTLTLSFPLSLAPLAAEVILERGVDVFTTLADGKTYYDFARRPIPAGFFCEGSQAFAGRVVLKGLPLATEIPGQLGNADTVVERLDNAVLNARGTATTRLRFKALSLVSVAPLQTACGNFHIYVSLNGKQRMTTMSIRRTDEEGGTFTAPLAVSARMTFIPVQPGAKAARPLELTGSFTFPPTSNPWSLANNATAKRTGGAVVDTNGDQRPDSLIPFASNFFAGRRPQSTDKLQITECGCVSGPPPCHIYQGEEHCAYPTQPGCMLELCRD